MGVSQNEKALSYTQVLKIFSQLNVNRAFKVEFFHVLNVSSDKFSIWIFSKTAFISLISKTNFLIMLFWFTEHTANGTTSVEILLDKKYCPEGTVMGPLVSNASPFLFPCTIEYSLICAVILFEIWKKVEIEDTRKADTGKQSGRNGNDSKPLTKVDRLVTTHFHFSR